MSELFIIYPTFNFIRNIVPVDIFVSNSVKHVTEFCIYPKFVPIKALFDIIRDKPILPLTTPFCIHPLHISFSVFGKHHTWCFARFVTMCTI